MRPLAGWALAVALVGSACPSSSRVDGGAVALVLSGWLQFPSALGYWGRQEASG